MSNQDGAEVSDAIANGETDVWSCADCGHVNDIWGPCVACGHVRETENQGTSDERDTKSRLALLGGVALGFLVCILVAIPGLCLIAYLSMGHVLSPSLDVGVYLIPVGVGLVAGYWAFKYVTKRNEAQD